MASQASDNTLSPDDVPLADQLAARLIAVPPELLVGPMPKAPDVDPHCEIVGTLTEDMRRLCIVCSQLEDEQHAEIREHTELSSRQGDLDEVERRRFFELTESLMARMGLHELAASTLWSKIHDTFSLSGLCPGHIFSDGTVGVHRTVRVMGVDLAALLRF